MKNIMVILGLLISGSAFCQTTLPSFFSSGMVLQRNENVAVWGWDEPGAKIAIATSWGMKSKVSADNNGKWSVELATPGAGGPYTINVKGSEEIILKDVLIGEVWLCSGQSNMEMILSGYTNQPIEGSNEAILNSENDQIRWYKAERGASLEPLDTVQGTWHSAEPSTIGELSATAYFFGKKLQEILKVPVGLITTSWGGSSVEAWMDEETISSFEGMVMPESLPVKTPNKKPSLLYNAMINPFVGYQIKGAIWYQGEANRHNPMQYKQLFPAMINAWRDKWQQGDFPFYFVQIAPFGYNGGVNSAFLREAQLYTMQHVKNTGMAVTLDIGSCRSIHPPKKKEVGHRLAYWALAKTYNIGGIACSGPVYKGFEKTPDGKITLSFDHAEKGLVSSGEELTGFTIAGDDRKFYPAQARITRDKKIIVWNPDVKGPVAVRYGFENCAEGTLFNVRGLPASSFRTDSWPVEEQILN